MKVYVVEADIYEQQYVAGVYSSPTAAMAAHPVSREARGGYERPGGWRPDGDGNWSNGLDMSYHARITEYVVDAG